MKWLENITKYLKLITNSFKQIKISRLAQASLAISILLLCRKLFSKKVSPAETKIILENISSFYDKLKQNKIRNVSILANSINYTDLQ
jgi:hypothetical protein